jgi:HSP20 family protein
MTTQAIDKPEHAEVIRTEHTREGRCYRPNVDIVETANELTLHADVPGVSRDGIDISFENGMLTIHGKVDEREREGVNVLLSEYGVGDFHRHFQVSESIDASKITAEYAKGVLTLHLPKVEAAKPRKITVHAK